MSCAASWLLKCAIPSCTTTSSKPGTSFLKPPSRIYSFILGVVYTKPQSPVMYFTGTFTTPTSLHGDVSSQFLQSNHYQLVKRGEVLYFYDF